MNKIIIVLGIFLLFLTGCEDKKVKIEEKFFIDIEWIRNSSDIEHLIFDKDGSFHYWCDCGNPVYDSDICDKYTYNENNNEITLICDGSKNRKLEIINVFEDKLEILFDD